MSQFDDIRQRINTIMRAGPVGGFSGQMSETYHDPRGDPAGQMAIQHVDQLGLDRMNADQLGRMGIERRQEPRRMLSPFLADPETLR